MKKSILFFILLIIISLGLSACDRSWVIEVDGYTLHKTDGKYYIAQIPDSAREESVYEIPTHVGEYEIYGFGSTRSYGIWAGGEEIQFGYIRKLVIKSHIKSVYFDTYKHLLIETEQPLSEINWNLRSFDRYNGFYFLSPKKEYDVYYVDESDCYDGIIYENKNNGFAKVLFNYSNEFIIHDEHKGIVVNEIGESSFYESNIKELKIPNNISKISDYAFQCSTLEKVVFNDNIVKIGKNAFERCRLKELNLPNVELEIDSYAFANNKISYLEIPENISKIDDYAFSNNEIESFKFESKYINHISTGMFSGCPLTGELNYGEYINSIGNSALSNNDREELVIPDSISNFGNISYCDNLKKIYLPNTSIKVGSFTYLDNLEEIHLGGTSNLDNFKKMYSVNNLKLFTVSEDNEYLYVNNGILYDKKTDAIVKCPPKLEIEKIEIKIKPYDDAFADNIYLKEAIVNCELSEGLFSYCVNLEKVQLHSSIKIIPRVTFFACYSLKDINLNDVVEVGEQAFYKCESLNKVDLSNCEIVDNKAFKECNLYEVIFTSKIKEIRNRAFANNKKLKKCNYFNATLGEQAFYDTSIK